MFPTFISILDIQSLWEVPSIAHFCKVFRVPFNLLEFDIEDLEEVLLTDGTEESSWLPELIVQLLSGCLRNNEISTFNYQMFLRRLFRQKCQDQYNPFNTDIDFQLLPLRTKLDILLALCDFRLDAKDTEDLLKPFEAEQLRVTPVGYDCNHSAYWYFHGTRLYREDFLNKQNNPNKKKSERAVWQVICFTEEDWLQLAKKLEKSNNKAEKELHQALIDNFLPQLPKWFKEKEKQARRRLLENLPRRVSSRIKEKESLVEAVVAPPPPAKVQVTKEEEELERKRQLQKQRQEAYERRSKLKEEQSGGEDEEESRGRSSSCDPQERYEMAGAKTQSKKGKTRSRKQSQSSSSSRDHSGVSTSSRNHSASGSASNSDKKKSSVTAITGLPTVGRQTNNSLACATGQIVIQPVVTTNRKKLKTSQVFQQTDEDLQVGMHKILDHIKNHEDAWPFIDPVEEEFAPNYYTVIRKPMDLQKMEERLDSGHYKTFSKFKSDFQLIVDNCRLYNGASNEYTGMVDNLLKVFEKISHKVLDQGTSSDEEIAVEYSIDKNQKRKKIEPPIVPSNKRKASSNKDKDKEKQEEEHYSVEEDESNDEHASPKKKAKKDKKPIDDYSSEEDNKDNKAKNENKKKSVSSNKKAVPVAVAASSSDDEEKNSPPPPQKKQPQQAATNKKKSKDLIKYSSDEDVSTKKSTASTKNVGSKNKQKVLAAKNTKKEKAKQDFSFSEDEEEEELVVKPKKKVGRGKKQEKQDYSSEEEWNDKKKLPIKKQQQINKAKANVKANDYFSDEEEDDDDFVEEKLPPPQKNKLKDKKNISSSNTANTNKKKQQSSNKDKAKDLSLCSDDESSKKRKPVNHQNKKNNNSSSKKYDFSDQDDIEEEEEEVRKQVPIKKKASVVSSSLSKKKSKVYDYSDEEAPPPSKKKFTSTEKSEKNKNKDQKFDDEFSEEEKDVSKPSSKNIKKKKDQKLQKLINNVNYSDDDDDKDKEEKKEVVKKKPSLKSNNKKIDHRYPASDIEEENFTDNKSKKLTKKDNKKDKKPATSLSHLSDDDHDHHELIKSKSTKKDTIMNKSSTKKLSESKSSASFLSKENKNGGKKKAGGDEDVKKKKTGVVSSSSNKNKTKDEVKVVGSTKKRQGRPPKKVVKSVSRSPTRSRSRSRSLLSKASSSPPPSWPPSSPDDNRLDFSPKSNLKKNCDNFDTIDKKNKDQDKSTTADILKDTFYNPMNTTTTTGPPKHKDKHNKLRETIEKLKAKSEIVTKLKEKEPVDSERSKENKEENKKSTTATKPYSDNKKSSTNKIKTSAKQAKEDEKESELKKQSDNIKYEQLSLVSEETLKEISMWLDSPQKFPSPNDASNSPSYGGGLMDDSDSKGELAINQSTKKIGSKNGALKEEFNINKNKKKPFHPRDPSKLFRRREVQRTIDRLQPGKSKGNLISSIQSNQKDAHELFPLGGSGTTPGGHLTKIKDTKNSLIVKTNDSAPKLSLGTVLNNFGPHKFENEEEEGKEANENANKQTNLIKMIKEESDDKEKIKKEEDVTQDSSQSQGQELKPKSQDDSSVKEEEKKNKKEENPLVLDCPGEPTPNLSAWFKAFGAPKVQTSVQPKKPEFTGNLSASKSVTSSSTSSTPLVGEKKESGVECDENKVSSLVVPIPDPSPNLEIQIHGQPGSRQRKISTGSSMSERSSFSQDMDSPRVGIDERLGAYPAPYPSPMHRSPSGASPVMNASSSPRPDVSPKTYSAFNGQLRVGFYQDTVSTKSSPDKSCSPRDNQQSPYPQYPEHVYTPSTTSTNTSYNSYYSNTNYSTSAATSNVNASSVNTTNEDVFNSSRLHHQHQQIHHHSDNSNSNSNNSNNSNSNNNKSPVSPVVYVNSPASNYESPIHQSNYGNSPNVQGQNSPASNYGNSPIQQQQLPSPSPSHSNYASPIHQSSSPSSPVPLCAPQIPHQLQQSQHSHSQSQQQIGVVDSYHHPQQQQQPPHQDIVSSKNAAAMFPVKKRVVYNEVGVIESSSPSSSSSVAVPNIYGSTIQSANIQKEVIQHQHLQQQQSHQQQPQQLHQQQQQPTAAAVLNESSNVSSKIDNYLYPNYSNNAPNSAYPIPLTIPSARNLTSDVSSSGRSLVNMGYSTQDVSSYSSRYHNSEAYSRITPNSSLQTQTSSANSSVRYHHENLSQNLNLNMAQVQQQRLAASISGSHSHSNLTPQHSPNSPQQADSTPSNPPNSYSKQVQAQHQHQTSRTSGVGVGSYNAVGASSEISGSGTSVDLRGNISNLSHIVDRFQSDSIQNSERMLHGGSVVSGSSASVVSGSVSGSASASASLQQQVNSPYYGDGGGAKNLMFAKPIATSASALPTMFSQSNVSSLPYAGVASHAMQAQPPIYSRQQMNEMTNSAAVAAAAMAAAAQDKGLNIPQPPERKTKRKKASKTAMAASSSLETSVNASSSQGFQSYMKSSQSNMEPNPISLKTASVVPGSAFNFGHSASGLSLSSSLYGEKEGFNFLEDFRTGAPNYYMAAAAAAHHRQQQHQQQQQQSQAENASKLNPSNQTPSTAQSSYPFIGGPQVRPPGYPLSSPFMPTHQASPLMDASSPLYQQYLQAGVIHQGLLGPTPTYPPGYHAALSMRQPYDSMTRPHWL